MATRKVVRIEVNGVPRELEVEARRTLADFLRDDLGLTGTHLGCEHGVCGACTVLLDGASVRSCILYAVQAEGAAIETVESLAPRLASCTRIQEAFRRCHGLQCGFCTPGFLMTAHELLRDTRSPSDDQIRRDDLRKPLPLHRLPRHRRVDPPRRRALAAVAGQLS